MLLALGVRPGHSHGDHHNHHPEAERVIKRSVSTLTVPRVALVRSDGTSVDFKRELRDNRPVFLNFVYTTCTTVCPVMSQVFAGLQELLGTDRDKVLLMSVSIDPEYDTPSRLKSYAQVYRAGEQWQFLTGDLDDMVAVQKAFGVYRGSKMNHEPTILLRTAEDAPWVRLDGLASAADVTREYRSLLAAR